MNECANLSLFYQNQISTRKFSDKLGRYYTPISIAEILCAKMGKYENKLVLDLGCGSGNLILGSFKNWLDCHYYAYDIDIEALNQLKSLSLKNVFLYNLDIVNQNINLKNFDLVITNPPYIYFSKDKISKYLDGNTEFEKEILKLNKIPAPLIFLTKAIRNVKTKGKIGIILPNGILTNKKYQSIRNILMNSYHIETVIQLEPYVFEKTETHAHMLIINNIKIEKEYNISFYFLKNNKLINNIIRSSTLLSNRLDFPSESKNMSLNKLGNFISSISRGKKSSKFIKDNPSFNILHTTDFEKNIEKFIFNNFSKEKINLSSFATTGDILIARVGRNFQNKIKIVPNGLIEVSDSVIIIRPKKNFTEFIFNYLTSEIGQRQLIINSQGTGAKYITHQHILNLPIIDKMDKIDGF